MSKRGYVRQELADIEARLADKDPDTVGEDMSDLAAVVLARYDQTITHEQIAELVTGRSVSTLNGAAFAQRPTTSPTAGSPA